MEITYDDVTKAMLYILDELPYDYRYTNPEGECGVKYMDCWNWHTDDDGNRTPGCIVGSILHKLGISFDDFSNAGNASTTLGYLQRAGHIINDKRVGVFLGVAQAVQDRGGTWRSAYSGAIVAVGYMDV